MPEGKLRLPPPGSGILPPGAPLGAGPPGIDMPCGALGTLGPHMLQPGHVGGLGIGVASR